ncbi:hypothetical protein JTL34_33835, partial [Pseudomonas aeruginosa]|nr:hypothetical protein [Pseudomonas aeruginosa]
ERSRYDLATIDHHQVTEAGLVKINLIHLIHSVHLEEMSAAGRTDERTSAFRLYGPSCVLGCLAAEMKKPSTKAGL